MVRPKEHGSRADRLGPEAGPRPVARGRVEGNPEHGCVNASKLGDVRGAHERAYARKPRDDLRVKWPVRRARHRPTVSLWARRSLDQREEPLRTLVARGGEEG